MAEAFDREAATFAKAAALCDPPVTPVEIPYGGTTFPGYWCSAGPGPRPLLVCTNGYDATVHEMYFALAQSAPDVYAALTCPKTPAHFTAAEGAGDHCAIMARTLLLQRMFDWLDDTLGQP